MAKVSRTVCLIGPESTGKTELAQRLAQHLKVPWSGEFAREYAEKRNNQLTYDDVEPIAKGQIETENRELRTGNALIKDTDLISTVVYSRYYYGRVPDWIVTDARKRKADLYLLMDTDVDWAEDGARDAPGDAREDLFDAFRAALDEFDARWVIVSGDWEERFQRALREILTL